MVLLACPKEFVGEAGRLQRNALDNWLRIGARPHLAGPARDVGSIPPELGIEGTVVESRSGFSPLPDFSDLLGVIAPEGESIQGYANADVIFPDIVGGFDSANGHLRIGESRLPDRFLIIGSRWDFCEGFNYSPTEVGDSVQDIAGFIAKGIQSGKIELNRPDAMDFFLFPPGLFHELGPLIVGRGGYDNALLAYCLRRSIPIIDVSRDWPVMHQFHGHAHKKGGKREVYVGEEAMRNRTEHDIVHSPPNSLDADIILEGGKLVRARFRCGVFRRLELTLRYRYGLKRLSYLFRALQRLSGERAFVERREMRRTMDSVLKLANT